MSSEITDRLNAERPSRAGDAFHYRWVAKRTLKLIEPNTKLRAVILDGLEPEAGEVEGDSVVDATEIWVDGGKHKIVVSQLKHSTKRVSEPFTLSGLKKTFQGFARILNDPTYEHDLILFQIITNRPFADSLLVNLEKLSSGEEPLGSFKKTIEDYTGLEGEALNDFSRRVTLLGNQGNYLSQEIDLAFEISDLIDKPTDSPELKEYIQFITDFVHPGMHKKITPVDVLRQLGVSHENELFPAPSEIEIPSALVVRSCYREIAEQITNARTPVVVTAEGGYGKTVALSALRGLFPDGSRTIVYDCFGSGNYRSFARARHRHNEAFLQIRNECAQQLLCGRKLRYDSDPIQATKSFQQAIRNAAVELRKTAPDGLLVILIDAGDNAKMAAELFEHDCFVDLLLSAEVPDGVRLVVSSRPERVEMLRLPASRVDVSIPPFDVVETLKHMQSFYPEATNEDAEELRRLTAGNPRIQRKAIAANGKGSLDDLMKSFGGNSVSLDEQIAHFLEKSVDKVRGEFSLVDDSAFDSICR